MKTEKSSTIDLDSYPFDPAKLSIDACQPSQLIKISSKSKWDMESLKFLSNFLQVSGDTTVLVFDLNQETPKLVDLLDEMD
jgi:hypothetical protein